MLVSIFWHGTGVLCLVAGALLTLKIIMILHKEKKSVVLYSICIGVASGLLGTICGGLFMLCLDAVIHIDARPGIYFAIRLIIVTAFFYLGSFLVGAIAGKLLRRICHVRATIYLSLMVTTFFVLQPIVYGWGKLILSNP